MPMIPQQQVPRQQPPKKSSGINKGWIVVAIVVVLAVILVIVVNLNPEQPQPPESVSLPEVSAPMSSSSDPVVQTSAGAMTDFPVPKASLFENEQGAFLFNTELVFPGADTLADENVITLGRLVSFTPIKSCTYQLTPNKLNIAHTAGAYMSVQRSSYTDKVDYTLVDQTITDRLADGLAKEVTLSSVYLGSTLAGRSGKAIVEINDKSYAMTLTYVFSNRELATVVTICEPSANDFIDVLYRSLNITGQTITLT